MSSIDSCCRHCLCRSARLSMLDLISTSRMSCPSMIVRFAENLNFMEADLYLVQYESARKDPKSCVVFFPCGFCACGVSFQYAYFGGT
jgi:hypothetical protein